MTTVGIIPARGGSKGIKKKNIVSFLGTPLIAHTIRQAKESERLDEVYISTDADDIATVSREYGGKVIERPSELAGDFSPTEDALIHALDALDEQGVNPETVVLLQCTSPLRRRRDIDNAVEMVTHGRYDSVLSCSPSHEFIWRDGTESAEAVNYDPKTRSMRQNIQQYAENGSIYVVKRTILENEHCRLGGNIGLYEMPSSLSFEIDEPEDLAFVRCVFKASDVDVLLAENQQ